MIREENKPAVMGILSFVGILLFTMGCVDGNHGALLPLLGVACGVAAYIVGDL